MSNEKSQKTAMEQFNEMLGMTEGLVHRPDKSTGGWESYHSAYNDHRVCLKKTKGKVVLQATVSVPLPVAQAAGLNVKAIGNGAITQQITDITYEQFEEFILPSLLSAEDRKAPPKKPVRRAKQGE